VPPSQHCKVAQPSWLRAGKMPALLSAEGAWPSRPLLHAGKMPALLSAEGSVAVPAASPCGQDARAPLSNALKESKD
jgi:hypothetical protein